MCSNVDTASLLVLAFPWLPDSSTPAALWAARLPSQRVAAGATVGTLVDRNRYMLNSLRNIVRSALPALLSNIKKGLLGNLLCTEGKPGKVLKVTATGP